MNLLAKIIIFFVYLHSKQQKPTYETYYLCIIHGSRPFGNTCQHDTPHEGNHRKTYRQEHPVHRAHLLSEPRASTLYLSWHPDQCLLYGNQSGFTFPGTQINACFTGTSLKLWAKPKSGYFMAQIDQSEPFKVALMGERDSVITIAAALPQGCHTVRLMYVIEGYELKPDFRGFILDTGSTLLPPPALPERTIEFIGNSITCGYGNEAIG